METPTAPLDLTLDDLERSNSKPLRFWSLISRKGRHLGNMLLLTVSSKIYLVCRDIHGIILGIYYVQSSPIGVWMSPILLRWLFTSIGNGPLPTKHTMLVLKMHFSTCCYMIFWIIEIVFFFFFQMYLLNSWLRIAGYRTDWIIQPTG